MKYAFLAIAIFMCLAVPASAASLYVVSSPKTAGTTVRVDVRATSDSESVNAVEGVVVFPSWLKLSNISTKGSFITFWVHGPVEVSSTDPSRSTIAFSGVIPGGLALANSLLFEADFTPAEQNHAVALLSLTEGRMLKSDGGGTVLKTDLKSVTVQLANTESRAATSSTEQQHLETDATAPEPFSIAIARNELVFDGAWFAIFTARDGGTGVDHYDAQEQITDKLDPSAWTRATNPMQLKDQTRHSYIFIRAVDRAGNARIATLTPVESQSHFPLQIILCILLVFLGIIWAILRYRHRASHEATM